MSSFPPVKWDVRHLQDFETYATSSVHSRRFLEALLVTDPAKGRQGEWRLMLSGNQMMEVNIRVADVLPVEVFGDMYVTTLLELGQHVMLQPNSTTSLWMDLETLVLSQDMDVFQVNEIIIKYILLQNS